MGSFCLPSTFSSCIRSSAATNSMAMAAFLSHHPKILPQPFRFISLSSSTKPPRKLFQVRSVATPAEGIAGFDSMISGTERKYYLLGGKGGVGKTSSAAALAVKFANSGHPTLVVSTDPAHSLSDSFAQDLTGGTLVPVEGPDSPLFALEINPEKAREEFRSTAQKNGGTGVKDFMDGMGLGMLVDQLGELKLGELLDTPPPGLDEAIAIAKDPAVTCRRKSVLFNSELRSRSSMAATRILSLAFRHRLQTSPLLESTSPIHPFANSWFLTGHRFSRRENHTEATPVIAEDSKDNEDNKLRPISELGDPLHENKDDSSSVKYSVLSNLKPSPRHDLAMIFTCKVCETRSVKTVCRESYEKGVVVARCGGCNNYHLIADHLGWFGEPGSVEDFLAARGEEVHKGSLDSLSLTLEDLAGKTF